MQLTTQRAQLSLADDEVVRLRDACDFRLEVVRGHVWLTMEGERNDVVIGAGENFLIDSSVVVTVSAIRGEASLRLCAEGGPARAHPALAARTSGWPNRLQQLLAGVSLSSDALA